MNNELTGEAKASPSVCSRCGEQRDKYGRCKPCRNARERKKCSEHRESESNEVTTCGKCGGSKIVGLHCKDCKNAANRKHRGTKRDYYNEQTKAWQANNRDRISEYRRSDPERLKRWRRTDYLKHKDSYRSANARRRRENPDGVRANLQAYRARKRMAPGSYTADQFILLKNLLGNRCYDCGEAKKLEVGHASPLARGGSNWIDNIIPQCRECNAAQHATAHKDFAIPENPLNGLLLNRA